MIELVTYQKNPYFRPAKLSTLNYALKVDTGERDWDEAKNVELMTKPHNVYQLKKD